MASGGGGGAGIPPILPVVPGRGPAGRGPAFGALTKVSLSLTHRQVTAGVRLAVTVTNANAFALSGSLTGHSRHRFPVPGTRLGHHTSKPIRLALTRFAVAAHGRTRVTFALRPPLRSRLARTHQLAVVLTARVTDPAGHTRRVTATLTVELKHAEHK
jgi:hypothetical protein